MVEIPDKEYQQLKSRLKELEAAVAERKRAEEALREREIKLQALFDALPVGISILDAERKIVYVNPALERILGIPREGLFRGDYKGRTYLRPDGTPMPAEEYASVRAVKEQRAVNNVETGVVKEDGNVVWTDVSAVPVTFPDWKVVIITSDITERKLADETLRESEEKYHSVAERANDGIIIIHDGIIKYVNRRLAEMYGDAVENIIGNPFKKFIAPEDLPKVVERYQKRMRGESLESMYEMMIQRKDGSRMPAELNAGTITYLGKPADLIFVRDITERKRMEEELRADEEKYRTLVENLPQKIFHKDKNSVYLSCNQNYAQDLKIKPNEIEGKTDYDFYPKELADKYRADDKRIMEAGKIEDIEEKYIQDGQDRYVHTVKTPVKDEKGNLIGILGIFWDITGRKQAEQELSQKIKELEKMTKIMEGREDRIIELKDEIKKLKGL